MKPTSRRHFIVAGTLAGAGAWIGFSRASAAETPSNRFGGFKIGIQSNSIASISPDLAKAIENIADVELHYAEFLGRHYGVTDDEAKIAESNAMLAKRQVRMESYFLGNMNPSPEAARRTFEFAKKVGVKLLVGQPSPESFAILDPLVKEFDIRIGIHNYGPGRQYDRVEDALKAAAPWDWRIGYCLDTGHCMRSGEDPVEAIRRMGHRLFGLHLRDHQSISREGRSAETIIGEGALNLKGLFQALRDVQFTGPASLEMYMARQNPLPAIRQSLDHLERAAKA